MPRRYDDDFGWHDFAHSVPRQAKGGIKAQTRRGAFGQSWWAKRWIAVLEGLHIGGRLDRGKSYARRGQVLDIEIARGTVSAKVQGSRRTPYKVSIALAPLPPEAWDRACEALAAQAAFAAKLLAGEMPQDIESAFENAGIPLFPTDGRALVTACSCPDWSNPCKHIAAVYYLLGEEFDRDPFLLFRLRGMERGDLVARLGAAAGDAPVAPAAAALPPEPLPPDPGAFWGLPALPERLFAAPPEPTVPAALARQLGPLPFWRAPQPLAEALERTYAAASAAASARTAAAAIDLAISELPPPYEDDRNAGSET